MTKSDSAMDSAQSVELTDSARRPSVLQQIAKRPSVIAAAAVLAIIVMLALAAPWILADPAAIDGANRLQPPRSGLWFGGDNFGRDVLARVVAGARSSLLVGAITALLAVGIGTTIALLSSMFRRVDLLLMRLIDGIMAFPVIVLALSMLAILGPGLQTIIVCLVIVMSPGVTRVVRSTALVVAELPMIESARVLGASHLRILFKYILPSCVTPILIQSGIIFTVAIIIESGLSFIGAGLPPDVPSWGDSLATSRNYLDTAWWLWVFPGMALVTVVFAVNTIIDAMRDAFDPRNAGR